MHPQQYWLPTVFAGTQKDTRDIGEESAMFAGTQKDTHDVGGEGAMFAGTQKDTRNIVWWDYFQCS